MIRSREELRLLRWPLLGLAAMLLLALGVGAAALHFVRESRTHTAAAEAEAARLRAEARRLQSEEQDMRAKISAYQGMAAHGMIGPEQRLAWVELIRTVQRERRLPGLEYEFQPQQALAGMNGNGGGYTFMNSPMRAKLDLLHEEDLLRFVADLQTQASALVRLRSCRVVRTDGVARNTMQPDANVAGPPPQLQADCLLDWITLQDNKAGKP